MDAAAATSTSTLDVGGGAAEASQAVDSLPAHDNEAGTHVEHSHHGLDPDSNLLRHVLCTLHAGLDMGHLDSNRHAEGSCGEAEGSQTVL